MGNCEKDEELEWITVKTKQSLENHPNKGLSTGIKRGIPGGYHTWKTEEHNPMLNRAIRGLLHRAIRGQLYF